ncbi:MAG: tetratricopeptide repeat protein [Archangium sp.]
MALLLVVVIAGCRASSPPAAEVLPSPSLDQRKALALALPSDAPELTRAAASVREAPELADRWVVLGQRWVRQARLSNDPGQYLSAEAAADVALSIQPEHSGATALLALVALNQHRFTQSKALAQKALAVREDDFLALAALADATLELGQLSESREAVQRMIDLKPSLPAYGRAAHLRALQGDVRGAQALYRQAIDSGRNPKDPEPQAWMIVQSALLFLDAGDVDGAEAGFALALSKLPAFPPALVGQARVALARGQASQAVTLLEQSITASPLVESIALLAEAHSLAGDAAGAEAAWARAELLGRQSDGLALGRAWAEANLHAQDAVKLLERENGERPNPFVKGALAWALFRSGRCEEARTVSAESVSSGLSDSRLRYQRAAVLAECGSRDDARQELEAVMTRELALSPRQRSEASALLRRLNAHAQRGTAE